MTVLDERALLKAELEAVIVERLSPSFVRVHLAGPELADLGVDGPWLDQRIKLVFPPGVMRTYTVRDVLGSGPDTRLVVDFVVHEDGHAGPGAGWAMSACAGDRVVVIAPRRGVPFGGIEFEPGPATSLLLVGDESAVPAVSGILRDLPADARGVALLEVPYVGDVLDVPAPEGVRVTWFARGEAPVGTLVEPAVREYAGLGAPGAEVDGEVDPDLWETPAYSSSGEPLDTATVLGHDFDGTFAWIAGECTMVTRLRRALVNEVGVDRRQVAFMGYWRHGVAMKG